MTAVEFTEKMCRENNQITATKLYCGNSTCEIFVEFTSIVLVPRSPRLLSALKTQHSHKNQHCRMLTPPWYRSQKEVASQLTPVFIPLQTARELCKDCRQAGKSLQLNCISERHSEGWYSQ